MLVDSSVWIEFLRGADSAEVQLLREALGQSAAVWAAPPVLQEVLQGADTPQRFERWDRTLSELPLLSDPDPRGLARESARLYARCRWQGTTIRSANDCLIAQYAVRNRLPLLHQDRDFIAISRVEPNLKLLSPLGRPGRIEAYEPDDGPLSGRVMAAIKKMAPQGDYKPTRSLFKGARVEAVRGTKRRG